MSREGVIQRQPRQGRDVDVMVVLPDLRPRGAERATLRLCAGLRARGMRVALAVCRSSGSQTLPVPAGIAVHELDPRGVLASVPRLVRLVRKLRPAGVISALTHTNIATATGLVMAGSSAPLVVVEHTLFSSSWPGKSARWVALAACVAFRRARAVVGVSRPVADDVQRSFHLEPRRVVVVPNAMDLEGTAALARLPLSPGSVPEGPLVVGVGSLAPEKDFSLLVRAFSVGPAQMGAVLALVGEGPERTRLETEVRSRDLAARVRLVGHDANPYRWIHRASVLVVSSHFEGLPTVALEALWLGTPVVVVDDGYGVRAALEDVVGTSPLLTFVPSRSEKDLGRTLTEVIARPPTPDVEVANRLWKKCSEERVAASYAALLGLRG